MKSAQQLKHVRSVSAYCLYYAGKFAGSIVSNWSDNPCGSVCTTTIRLWAGPLKVGQICTGRAGGGGYCKFSASVDDAIRRGGMLLPIENIHGAGEQAVESYFESHDYEISRILGV